MKLFFFILFLSTFLSFSQDLSGLKYDKLVFSESGNTAIVSKGKKEGLYDLTGKRFLIEPAKQKLIAAKGETYDGFDKYILIGKEIKSLVIADQSGELIQVPLREPYAFVNYCADTAYYKSTRTLGINGHSYLMDEKKFDSSYADFSNAHFGAEIFLDNYLLINDFREVIGTFDENGDLTLTDSALQHSGIMNLETGLYEIPPVYADINRVGNYFFCRKNNYTETVPWQMMFDIFYDIYSWDDGKFLKIKSDAYNLTEPEIAGYLGYDEVIPMNDEVHYITMKDGKMGFIFFSLSWVHSWSGSFQFFAFCEFKAPEFQFVHYNTENNTLLSADQNGKLLMEIRIQELIRYNYVGEFFIVLDQSMRAVKCEINPYGDYIISNDFGCIKRVYNIFEKPVLVSDNLDSETCEKGTWNYGLEWLNDSILILTDFSLHRPENYPLMSQVYMYEDSIDWEGNVVYGPAELPVEKSGVYNINTNQWIVSPEYRYCLERGGGILATRSERDAEDEARTMYYSYHFSLTGNSTFSAIPTDSLYRNNSLLQFCVWSELADTIFFAPSGQFTHPKYEMIKAVYAGFDGQWLIYDPALDRPGFPAEIEEPKDFIHANPDYNCSIWLNNDSTFVVFEDKSWTFGPEINFIELRFNTFADGGLASVWMKWTGTQSDSLFIEVSETVPEGKNVIVNSLERRNDLLILNETGIFQHYNYGGEYEEIYEDLMIERECSSVWQKTETGWGKVSPYYAMVIPVENGYIVKTGDFKIVSFNMWTEENYYEDYQTGRYILLDADLNARMFLDWFDFSLIQDLGFGLKICTDQGCFFSDYDGNALTNAEWDHFELEDGKIKAVKYGGMPFDEFGDFLYDEYGNIIELEDKVQYFNFK